MALNIGELVGYLDLDAGPFEKGLGKAFDSMGSKKWQVAGAAAGVAAGTAILAGMLSSMETEKLNNKMAASLGLTKEQSATAGKAAGQLYADNYGSSMEDVTGAVEGVMSSIKGMRTASQADIQAVTKDVLNLASAFGIDASDASQLFGTMITQGLAKDGAHAADLLTAALQKVPAAARDDVMAAADEYSQFFAGMGFSGEQAMAVIVKGSEKGKLGIDKAADAIKELQIRSTDMSKSSTASYKDIGLDAEKMAGKFAKGGSSAKEAMGEVVQGLLKIKDPVARSNTAIGLFGTQFEDLGGVTGGFLESMASVDGGFGKVTGKAKELDTTLGAGASNGWTKFQRAGETAMSAIGEKVLPILTPIIDKMAEWAPILGPLVLALAGFAGIMAVVNFVMATSPITWIILGIVALIAIIVLLVMNWQQVVDFLGVIWGGFINWCIEIIDGFVVWWNGVWAGVGKFISDTWNNIVNWVRGAINNVSNTIRSVAAGIVSAWNGFWGQVGAKVGQIWESIKTGVSNGITAVVNFVRDLPGKVLGFFANAGTLLLSAGGNIIDGFLKGLTQGFEDVKNFVGGIGDWIAKNKGPKAYDLALLIPAGGWIMDGLGKGIKASMPGLQKILGNVSATIATGVTGGTVGLAGIPGNAPAATTGTAHSGGTVNNWHLYEQSDPAATAMNVARRQAALAG
jgi:phage-related minor tail protein